MSSIIGPNNLDVMLLATLLDLMLSISSLEESKDGKSFMNMLPEISSLIETLSKEIWLSSSSCSLPIEKITSTVSAEVMKFFNPGDVLLRFCRKLTLSGPLKSPNPAYIGLATK